MPLDVAVIVQDFTQFGYFGVFNFTPFNDVQQGFTICF